MALAFNSTIPVTPAAGRGDSEPIPLLLDVCHYYVIIKLVESWYNGVVIIKLVPFQQYLSVYFESWDDFSFVLCILFVLVYVLD